MDLQLLFKQYLHHKQFINSSHFEKEMIVTCDKSALGVRRVHLINHQTKSRPRRQVLRAVMTSLYAWLLQPASHQH